MEEEEIAKFVTLPSQKGRRVAYRELGHGDKAVLVIHGLMSCRISAMPGVKEETLREYGVKLVAIDRPGYGQSDPHPSETFKSAASDIEQVIDALALGNKVWLLGVSMGGAFCWAAARFIPHRIAGIALWAPVGNLFWKGISSKEQAAMLVSYSRMERAFMSIARVLPFCVFKWLGKQLGKQLANGTPGNVNKGLPPEDWTCLNRPGVNEKMAKDSAEALKYHGGFGVAKDLQMMHTDWGFEIKEVGEVFHGRIHIWQGDKDRLVPIQMQRWVREQLHGIVALHELHGEGHLSWWCFNDEAHHETLRSLTTGLHT